jgi:DNA-directed RNA polymerase subunit H (RpoH/RPB5)
VHEHIPVDKVPDLLNMLKTTKDKLPKIHANDTSIVWLGLRAGDVVKVYRNSDLVGETTSYRLILKATPYD